jgi:hypothetical protein
MGVKQMQPRSARPRARISCSHLICICLLIFSQLGTLSAQQGKPLTESEVLALLEGGVSSGRVASLVEERSIDFEVTPQVETKLRGAGATNELMVTLRLASKLRKETASAKTATLKVVSKPGEAEVYLDDQPKGTTSAAGILELRGLDCRNYRLRVVLKGFETWNSVITLNPGETQIVTATLAKRAEQEVQQPQLPSKPKSAANLNTAAVLREARTLCILLGPGSNAALKTEIEKKILKWGRLNLVSSPEGADLILDVHQTGHLYKSGPQESNQAAAILKSREFNAELWSITKGGVLSLRGYSISWVGQAIADELIKFFTQATGAPKK